MATEKDSSPELGDTKTVCLDVMLQVERTDSSQPKWCGRFGLDYAIESSELAISRYQPAMPPTRPRPRAVGLSVIGRFLHQPQGDGHVVAICPRDLW